MKLSAIRPGPGAAPACDRETSGRAAPFHHQSYSSAPPDAPHHYVRAPVGPRVASGEFQRRMRAVGQTLRAAPVGAIYLVHSSFAALDSLSVLAALGRHDRPGRESVRRIAAQMVDAAVHDAGNYTQRYAGLLQAATESGDGAVPVRLVSWSSENHHLGRADAAVRLIDELAALELPPGTRLMLWGHGHAGNVFALMSQLLSSDAAALDQFFAAARIYYRWPLTGWVDVPVWRRVRQLLTRDRHRLAQRPLDWVTFGTAVRYGWKLREGDRLLHFIHHRPSPGRPAHMAAFPARLEDVTRAAAGDYLQQVAIAGTDEPPSPLAWRQWLADRRLEKLLAPNCEAPGLADRLQAGARVPDCGATLLVDYGLPDGPPAEHLAGHAVYTRPEWLLFHAERVVQHLHGGAGSRTRAA